MACLNTLKQEIRVLENAFPKTDELFQVVAASVDELTCRFISKTNKKYDIHANITVSMVSHSQPLVQPCKKRPEESEIRENQCNMSERRSANSPGFVYRVQGQDPMPGPRSSSLFPNLCYVSPFASPPFGKLISVISQLAPYLSAFVTKQDVVVR